jgi:replicative DNA helicase
VETRGGEKRPILSDLRESGAIEQDADIVCFIYRPEYYGMTVDEAGNSLEGIGEIIIAKHRNGALETVKLRFVGKFARFENLEGPSMDLDTLGGLQPNTDFDRLKTMTKPSRMNEDLGGDMGTFSAGSAGDVPF